MHLTQFLWYSPYWLCLLVAAIVADLSFFLHQEETDNNDSLERAVQLYQQSTCDASVKKDIENLFKYSSISGFFNRLTGSNAIQASLYENCLEIVMNNLLSMISKSNSFLFFDEH